MHTPASFFNSLPAYLGGKRPLCPLIFALLSQAVDRPSWSGMTFLDPFLGGGAASLYAKAVGFRVLCNDLAFRSSVVGSALIANSHVKLTQADVAGVLRQPPQPYRRLAEEKFSPAVFAPEQAKLIDRAIYWLCEAYSEPRRSMLMLVLSKWILRQQPMSMLRGTDVRAAADGDFDRVSPRRVGHYLRARRLLSPSAWWRIAQEVNRGVFAGQGEAHQGDALEFLENVAVQHRKFSPMDRIGLNTFTCRRPCGDSQLIRI